MVAIPKQWPFMDPSTAIYGHGKTTESSFAQGYCAQDGRFAWKDHFLEDRAMRWRGCEGLYLPLPLLTKEGNSGM